MKQTAFALVIILYLLSIAHAKTFFTRYNELCVSECTTTDHDYNWCWTGKPWPNSWNYCSPRENVDRYGTACRSGHSCAQHEGTSYNWCRHEDGSWDYCGKVTNNLEVIASNGYYCNDDCTQQGVKLILAGDTVHQKKVKTILAIAVMLVATVIKIPAHPIIGAM